MASDITRPLIKAVLLDFDGLIFDTETAEYASWQAVFAQHGAELPFEEWAEGIGRGADEFHWDPLDALEAQLGRAVDREAVSADRRRRFAELVAREKSMPGVDQLLQDARILRLAVGVASSATHSWVEGFLHQLGLFAHFDVLMCRDDVLRSKPDPELYVRLLEALHLSPAEAIALEDSPNGVAAAKAAGLYCIAVPNQMTRALCFDHADRRIESLMDLRLAEYARPTRKG